MQKLKLHVANSKQTDSRGMWPVFGGVVLSSSIHLLPISTSFEIMLLIFKIFMEDD